MGTHGSVLRQWNRRTDSSRCCPRTGERRMPRIHILGASGSGTTTLGAAVAGVLSVPHLDTDVFFWLPTDPPFTTRRPLPERLALLRERLSPAGGWVLSGSAVGWAKPIEPLY